MAIPKLTGMKRCRNNNIGINELPLKLAVGAFLIGGDDKLVALRFEPRAEPKRVFLAPEQAWFASTNVNEIEDSETKGN